MYSKTCSLLPQRVLSGGRPKAEWPAVLANRNKIGLTTTCFEQAGAEEKVLVAAIVG
jgi:hypothetical protein